MSLKKTSRGQPTRSQGHQQPSAAQKKPSAPASTMPAKAALSHQHHMAAHQLRLEDRHRQRERERRQQLLKRIALLGGSALLGIAMIGFLVHAITGSSSAGSSPTHVSNAPIPGIVTYANLSRQHVTGHVTYAQNPPVGGPHNPVWLNCGIYNQPVPNENAVHSLEHGAVWMTYQPNLPTAQVAQLRTLVLGHSYVILSPYPGLPAPVVASAWGAQVQVSSASDPRLGEFIHDYEQGPQTPEPGELCSGGTGTPSY